MHTAIIATLEKKGILTREEGEALVEFINNRPQSTLLADAVEQVGEFIKAEVPKIAADAKAAVKDEAAKITKTATSKAKKAAETTAKEVVSDAAAAMAADAAAEETSTTSDAPASETTTEKKPTDSSDQK